MGAKQSKIEGCYLPSTPTVQTVSTQRLNMNTNSSKNESINPRSPSGSRTPINVSTNSIIILRQYMIMILT